MKRSKFPLSYLNSTTLDAGYLVPVYWEDVLPGDKLRIGFESFIRCQPMLSPLMHQVNMYMQYWYVPYRLLWDKWTEFITGGEDGTATPVYPTIKNPDGFAVGSFADYFFGSDARKPNVELSALPFRANALIWNSRYRDEDLQDELPISFDSGLDSTTSLKLLSPNWKKDYFTTARTSTQRGSQISVPVLPVDSQPQTVYPYASNIPLVSTEAITSKVPATATKVINIDVLLVAFAKPKTQPFQGFFTANITYLLADGSTELVTGVSLQVASYLTEPAPIYSSTRPVGVSPTSFQVDIPVTSGSWSLAINPDQSYHVAFDTLPFIPETASAVGSLDIRDLRLSSALQRYQERSLLWGNRYEEFIQREFGVRPSDARIQRPEFLGGSKSQMLISEVLQTAEGNSTGVGTMRGNGVGVLSQRPIRFFAPEHGVVIGYLSIRPKLVYTQGIERAWLKRSKLDFFTPELASIGMQEVLEQEIFADADNVGKIFGYQDRYQEYRRRKDMVSGEFVELLNYWNMALRFADAPVVNDTFINMANYADTFKRPFLVQDQAYHSYMCMIANKVKSWRPIPKRAKNILK